MIETAVKLAIDESSTLNGLRETEIRNELERILRSRVFVHSHRIRRFLQFVVEECLMGQHHRLKEYLIGLEVFNRQEAFDPRVDSIVRVEARRLRTKLEEYYLSEGSDSEIRIQLRKGSYVPVFEHRGSGMTARTGYGKAAPRRSIGVGAISVFNGGANHDSAVEDVKRRIAHVLIKEGYFQVTGAAEPRTATETPLENAEAATEALQTDYFVEGSMHFHVDRVNVILQLLSTSDGSYSWSEQVDCKLDDLTPVEELARSLNRVLITAVTSGDAGRARRNGGDRQSFDLYLQGRYNWKIGTPESIRNSIPLFTKAIEHDPSYAAAWAALSESLLVSSVFGYVNSTDSAGRMKEAAQQATTLNENLPEARVAQGAVLSILDWDWLAGERELQRAIQLAPSDPSGHIAYGLQLACRRMPEAAITELETALELDPASLFTNFALGWLHTVNGKYDEAIVQHRVVAQLAPDFPLSYLGLGWAHTGKGLYRDAIAYFTNGANLLKARTLLSGCLGYCYAKAGDRDEALRQLLLLDASSSDADNRHQLWPVSAAAIYCGLGDNDRALTYLEEAVASHNTAVPLRTLTPEFASLRGEPRFAELQRKMGMA
jgi:serine/threonine-protein kinase